MVSQVSSPVIYMKDIRGNKDNFQRLVSQKAINGVKLFINSNEGVYLGVSPKQKRKIDEKVKVESIDSYGVSSSGFFQAEFLGEKLISALDFLRKLPYNYSIEYDTDSKMFFIGNYLDNELYISSVKWRFLLNDLDLLGFKLINGLVIKKYPEEGSLEISRSNLINDFYRVVGSISTYGTSKYSDISIRNGSMIVGRIQNPLLDSRNFESMCRLKELRTKGIQSYLRPIKKGVFEVSKALLLKKEYIGSLLNVLKEGNGFISLHFDGPNNRWLLIIDSSRFYDCIETYVYFSQDSRCRVVEKF